MLAPRASGAFVCLRCELGVLRPRLPLTSHRLAHANLSTSARHRDEADQIQTPRARPRGHLTAHPLGRVRRRKGKAIRETTERLGGVKTLGDDAQILVLNELGEPSRKEVKPEPTNHSEATPDAPQILASLQQEDRPLTPEEINKQLESLRPQTYAEPDEPHYISQTEFVKLIRVLSEGFTVSQLSRYYSSAKGVQQKHVKKEVIDGLKGQREKGLAKKPVERTEWHPGTTNIKLRLPGLDVAKRSKRRPIGKPLLIDQILRDVWRLVLLEEIEASGELEMSLKPWQMSLLTIGETPTALDTIGQERKVKIELHLPHDVVRITADKTTAEYAADDIEKLLQHTEKKKMDLAPWAPFLEESNMKRKLTQLYSPQSLEAVASLSRTSVQLVRDDTVIIRGLDKFSIEEAERALLRLLPFKTFSSHTLDTDRLDATRKQSYLLPTAYDQTSLDFQHHNQRLGRWSLPVVQPSSDSMTGESSQDTTTPQKVNYLETVEDKFITKLKNSRYFAALGQPRPTGFWVHDMEEKMVADFGQVLCPIEPSSVSSDSSSVDCDFSNARFSPAFPGLTRLLTSDAFEARFRTESPSLEYEFLPAPGQANFNSDQVFPNLQIRFRADKQGSVKLTKLHLDFNKHVHDVLLPDKAVDVRLRTSNRLTHSNPLEDINIKEFASAVSANVESGARLTAPSIQIDIPKWAIPGFYNPGPAQMRTVKYKFSGIRFRQSVSASLLGLDVGYSTVQSGKLGMKGGQLSAYYNMERKSGNQSSQLRDPAKIKSFIKSCFGIVDHITAGSAETRPLKKVASSATKDSKPRHEFSERKLRRRAEFGSAEEKQGLESELSETAGTAAETSVVTDVGADKRASVQEGSAGEGDPIPTSGDHGFESGVSENPKTTTTTQATSTPDMNEDDQTSAQSDTAEECGKNPAAASASTPFPSRHGR